MSFLVFLTVLTRDRQEAEQTVPFINVRPASVSPGHH